MVLCMMVIYEFGPFVNVLNFTLSQQLKEDNVVPCYNTGSYATLKTLVYISVAPD